MVERVCRGADREDRPVDGCCAPMDGIRCTHVGVMCGLSHQEPGQQKKRRSRQERRFEKPGEIFVRRISPRRTSIGSLRSATVGFLRPRLAALGFTQRHS